MAEAEDGLSLGEGLNSTSERTRTQGGSRPQRLATSAVMRGRLFESQTSCPISHFGPHHPQPFPKIAFPTLRQGRDLQGALDGTGVGFGIMFGGVEASDLGT